MNKIKPNEVEEQNENQNNDKNDDQKNKKENDNSKKKRLKDFFGLYYINDRDELKRPNQYKEKEKEKYIK